MKKISNLIKITLMLFGALYIIQYTSFLGYIQFWFGEDNTLSFDPSVQGIEIEEIIKNAQKDWQDPKYKAANTAQYADYMTDEEKQVIYYLNLARMNPQLFAKTFVEPYKGVKFGGYLVGSPYKASLLQEMSTLRPRKPLKPNRAMWEFALCHATNSGKKGITGHDREASGCPRGNFGECCSYGEQKALAIILSLLIDHDVPSLGHRILCFSPEFTSVGVSIQPHKGKYIQNAVLDFSR
jgi:uncharacterized protein YkwD